MARVPYVDPKDTPPGWQISNIGRALANSPGVSRHSNGTARYIRHESKLDPRLRELAILQVGYCARSEYEYAHHCDIALTFKVSEKDILAIADETAGRPTHLDPLAKAVLKAAREMSQQIALSDETFAALRQGLDNEHLVDLLYAIANYNGVVRLLAAMKIDLEDKYRPYLDKFPLPRS
jgi:alkylhydroperoxidase family enzyme